MAFGCLAFMFVLGVFVICHYYERLQTQNTQGTMKSILPASKVLFCRALLLCFTSYRCCSQVSMFFFIIIILFHKFISIEKQTVTVSQLCHLATFPLKWKWCRFMSLLGLLLSEGPLNRWTGAFGTVYEMSTCCWEAVQVPIRNDEE